MLRLAYSGRVNRTSPSRRRASASSDEGDSSRDGVGRGPNVRATLAATAAAERSRRAHGPSSTRYAIVTNQSLATARARFKGQDHPETPGPAKAAG